VTLWTQKEERLVSKTALSVANMTASEKAKLNAMLDSAVACLGYRGALTKEQRYLVMEKAKIQILAARQLALLERQRKAEREQASAESGAFSWSASVTARPRR
jgi:hypothetical protein